MERIVLYCMLSILQQAGRFRYMCFIGLWKENGRLGRPFFGMVGTYLHK